MKHNDYMKIGLNMCILWKGMVEEKKTTTRKCRGREGGRKMEGGGKKGGAGVGRGWLKKNNNQKMGGDGVGQCGGSRGRG